MAAKRDEHRFRHAQGELKDISHQRRECGSTNDSHQQRSADFRVRAQSLQPRPKIVGNIREVKKLVRKMDHKPIHPGKNTPVANSNTFTRL